MTDSLRERVHATLRSFIGTHPFEGNVDTLVALIKAEIARELRTLAKDCAERHTDEVVDRQVGWNNALTEVAKEARRRAAALEGGEKP